MYIYLITNLINNKKYVGLTSDKNPINMWNSHRYNSVTPKTVIQKVLNKYGFDNFKFEVIDESANTIDELNDLEKFYISLYDTYRGEGYNCTSGGESHNTAGGFKWEYANV